MRKKLNNNEKKKKITISLNPIIAEQLNRDYKNVSKYIENVFTNQSSKQHEEIEPLREEMMMGLRLIEGINVTEVENKYKINLLDTYPKLNYYIKEGLLKMENNKLSFTKTGLMLGNLVFSIF